MVQLHDLVRGDFAGDNVVVIKPGAGSSRVARKLADCLYDAGLEPGVLQVLDEAPAVARGAIRCGVDKIVLTGSAETGSRVLGQAAPLLTPCTLELSGCDAVFVRADADIRRAAQCIAFGLRLNGSATCIAPRRVFVHREVAASLEASLKAMVDRLPPVKVNLQSANMANTLIHEAIANGARQISLANGRQVSDETNFRPTLLRVSDLNSKLLQADFFAPVLSLIEVENDDDAMRANSHCPYALGAAIFGNERSARNLAARVPAGCITINDLIAPTAAIRVCRSAAGIAAALVSLAVSRVCWK
jgi:acyl-CoA reductase-like NAD-dependent aldehyde dehydrogenase